MGRLYMGRLYMGLFAYFSNVVCCQLQMTLALGQHLPLTKVIRTVIKQHEHVGGPVLLSQGMAPGCPSNR